MGLEAFRKALADKGQRAFVRYSRGQDVMAACGQLALVETRVWPMAPPTDAQFRRAFVLTA